MRGVARNLLLFTVFMTFTSFFSTTSRWGREAQEVYPLPEKPQASVPCTDSITLACTPLFSAD